MTTHDITHTGTDYCIEDPGHRRVDWFSADGETYGVREDGKILHEDGTPWSDGTLYNSVGLYRALRAARVSVLADELTEATIRALRVDAGFAGDEEQIEICNRAIDGDAEARRQCAEVIAEGLAQDTDA